ncbi:MAG: SDR family oxidoreductase [Desulfobacteraceae bacterium]|nr:SDR family oxidoreductase [Desulfobacteraceae bacterium]
MEIKKKVALVLGAVKGIGKGIGLALAKEGASLILTRYDWEDSFKKMESDFINSEVEYHIVSANLKDIKDIQKLSSLIRDRYGRLDIFINNIERGGWPVVHGEYTQDQWDLEMETTLRAKRWVFNEVYPLLQQSDDAVVINISSIAAIVGRSGPAAAVFNDGYAAANRGVSSLTETWARMGAPKIRVNEIMLGIFETRHAQGTRGWEKAISEEEKKALINHIPMGRTGKINDVVAACLFIIKDAPYLTGVVLRLDGGYVLGGEKMSPMPKGIL